MRTPDAFAAKLAESAPNTRAVASAGEDGFASALTEASAAPAVVRTPATLASLIGGSATPMRFVLSSLPMARPPASPVTDEQRDHPGDRKREADDASAGANAMLPAPAMQSHHPDPAWHPATKAAVDDRPADARPVALPKTDIGNTAKNDTVPNSASAATRDTAAPVTVLRQETHFAPSPSPHERSSETTADANASSANSGGDSDEPPHAQTTAEAAAKLRAHARAGDEPDARAEALLPQDAELTEAGPLAPVADEALPMAARQEIADVINGEAATMSRPVRNAAATPEASARGAVRILELSLTQEDLGRIVVRLRMTATGLEIRLAAANPQTAQLLERDRASLLRLIKADGLALHELTIDGGAAAATVASAEDRARRIAQNVLNSPPDGNEARPERNGHGQRKDQDARDDENTAHPSGFAADLD